MAKENRDWGYDRIAGTLANLGYEVCDQTVGNVLQRHALPPAPERKRTTPWPAFIRTHLALLAGTDFFTAEVLTLRGLVTYYVLFFIHLESRRMDIAGITVHPDEPWMQQMARNVTMEGCGALRDCRYLLHDRDTKYTQSFRAIIASGQVEPLVLPARSPNLNAYAERWVRSVKEECLSKVYLPVQHAAPGQASSGELLPDELLLELLSNLDIVFESELDRARSTYEAALPPNSDEPTLDEVIAAGWLRVVWGRISTPLEIAQAARAIPGGTMTALDALLAKRFEETYTISDAVQGRADLASYVTAIDRGELLPRNLRSQDPQWVAARLWDRSCGDYSRNLRLWVEDSPANYCTSCLSLSGDTGNPFSTCLALR